MLLLVGSMHVLLQLMRPFSQDSRQLPLEQICPAPHTAPTFAARQSPLAPQKELLLRGSRQVPLQLIRPAWQLRSHVPFEQISPAWHTLPTCVVEQSALAPQKELLLLGSTQVPLQLMRPVWQVRLHVPLEQTWPTWQTLPECVPEQAALAPQ
ncbi:MAG TPA: hypothetical protein VF331_26770 [Polyangiales bacterium]